MKIDPASIPGAWPQSGGFTIPDWESIARQLLSQYDESNLNSAYYQVCDHWLQQLRDEIGGDYHIVTSKNFHLLTAQTAEHSGASLQILEDTHQAILSEWPGVASDAGFGPQVAIIFDETDDYYDYIGQYFPDVEQEFGGSSGIMLDRGYGHIAIAHPNLEMCSRVLFHEMTHLLVAHLPLPLWINEGLATSAERVLSGNQHPLLREELAQKHYSYWNENTIQHFWNGESFFFPGDAQELSYNLAEILATQLRTIPGYREFILNATWEDAGEAAAREYLKAGVGDIAAIFLGDGPWGVDWSDEEQSSGIEA